MHKMYIEFSIETHVWLQKRMTKTFQQRLSTELSHRYKENLFADIAETSRKAAQFDFDLWWTKMSIILKQFLNSAYVVFVSWLLEIKTVLIRFLAWKYILVSVAIFKEIFCHYTHTPASKFKIVILKYYQIKYNFIYI